MQLLDRGAVTTRAALLNCADSVDYREAGCISSSLDHQQYDLLLV